MRGNIRAALNVPVDRQDLARVDATGPAVHQLAAHTRLLLELAQRNGGKVLLAICMAADPTP